MIIALRILELQAIDISSVNTMRQETCSQRTDL
jgi:hypothetical protein